MRSYRVRVGQHRGVLWREVGIWEVGKGRVDRKVEVGRRKETTEVMEEGHRKNVRL